ncbi:hypothetical protein C8Q79DRAFT_916724 [Trametes meyenii]|nr:hypothetical protein C8Q79DRAFT_916724 [Trametes meyenii]
MELSNDIAALIAFACESALWGAYCILFLTSMGLLRQRGRLSGLNLPIVITHCLLFVLCTTHYALKFNHFYTTLQSTGVSGFAGETPPLIAGEVMLSLSNLLGDAILTYRCWIIWGRSYKALIAPVITMVATCFLIRAATSYVEYHPTPSDGVPSSVLPFVMAGYALPLCTNAIITLLIVVKIWSMARPTPSILPLGNSTQLAGQTADIIIESGLIYFVTQMLLVVFFAIGCVPARIVDDVSPQIYGITSTLITIRTALGITWGGTTVGQASPPQVVRVQDNRSVVGNFSPFAPTISLGDVSLGELGGGGMERCKLREHVTI